jgi:hypothetical protein
MTDNHLIAKFMGGTLSDHPKLNYVKVWSGQNCPDNIRGRLDLSTTLKYDIDWNWLMPVIDKIESLNLWEFDIYRQSCEVSFDDIFLANPITFTRSTRLEATYSAVIAFLKWYNTQQN